MNITATVNGGDPQDMSIRELTRDWILEECFDDLAQSVGAPFGGAGCDSAGAMVMPDPSGGPGAPANAPIFNSPGSCTQALCWSVAAICVANRLLELSTTVAPATFKKSAQDSITVPAQDTESNIWFAEDAWHYAAWSATVAAESLKGTAACTTGDLTSLKMPVSGTVGYDERFASGLADAYMLAQEAARSATSFHAAVSDADFSRTADLGVASRFAWSDGSMSRSRASKLLTGGKLNMGLAGFHAGIPSTTTLITDGVCPIEPPQGKTVRAVDVIRLAGPSLNDVTSNLSVSSFLANAILPRLAERFPDEPSYANTSAFLEQQGLSEQDFTNARAYLTQEAQAFARGTSAQLPVRPIPSGRNADGTLAPQFTSIPIYAETATPPPALPAVHLRTMSRFAGTDLLLETPPDVAGAVAEISDGSPAVSTDSLVPTTTYARSGLAQLTDYVGSTARGLLGSSFGTTALDTLAGVAGGTAVNARGRVETCYRYYNSTGTTADEIRVRVFGYTNYDDIEILSGISSLRCAVDGEIEGGPCTASDIVKWGNLTGRALGPGGGYLGYLSSAEVKRWSAALPASNRLGPYLYIVRKEPGNPALPGYYRALGAIRLVQDQTYGAGWRYCSQYPINDDTDRQVETTLTPSPDSCSQPETSCSGETLFSRIPLESELSTDSDPYESSWRVYLERAQAAADRADELGEELIAAGLDIDRREETAWEALEALCGGPINLSDQFLTPRGPACMTEGEECATPVGSICRGGYCAVDPVATLLANTDDPAAQRLAECLGVQGVEPFATLGTDRMCVWVENGVACEDPEDEVDGPCPYPPDVAGACTMAPTGAMSQPVDVHLNVFHDQTDAEQASPACSLLRKIRSAPSDQRASLVKRIAGWRFFTASNMQKLAERVGWEARPDDYSAITLDGITVWSTGDGVDSPGSSTWPCTGAYADRESASMDATTCTGGTAVAPSLFCSSVACLEENDSDRAVMNYRMARAVFALRILSGVGLGPSFIGPYLPDQGEWTGTAAKSEEWDGDTFGELYEDYPTTSAHRNAPEVSSLVYHSGTSGARRPVGGRAVCIDDTSAPPDDDFDEDVWTTVSTHLESPTFSPKSASCDARESTWIPIFTAYPGSLGDAPNTVTSLIWHGLDGTTWNDHDDAGFNELAIDLLFWPPPDPDHIEVSGSMGDDDPEMPLTTYWDDDYFDFEWMDENEIAIAKDGIAARDVLDAMEVACEVQRLGTSFVGDCPAEPPAAEDTLASLALSQQYLKCKAHDVLTSARRKVLANVPKEAIAALDGTLGYEGELGAAAGDIARVLATLEDKERNIENALTQVSIDVETLRLKLAMNEHARERLHLQVVSGFLNALAGCAGSIAGIFAPGASTSSRISDGSSCANTATQFGFSLEDAALAGDDINLDDSLTWQQMKSSLNEHAEAINDNADELDQAVRELRSALTRVDTQRQEGLRDLTEAMMLGTDAAGTQFAVNTVMRRRYNTLQVRYNEARAYAVKMAWLARRAIEQRIGFHLEDLDQPMTLVEAPSTWANTLCTSSGIDYAQIRDDSQLDADNYADAYIGDYVRKLERVMDSYEHDFPFGDAQDTAVISLRDDVTATRATCEISVPNLLAYSGLLDTAYDPETGSNLIYDGSGNLISGTPPTPVWETVGCEPEPVSGDITNCIGVTRLPGDDAADVPIPEFVFEAGEVPGYRITFAPGSPPGPTSLDADSALVQRVTLPPGYYRLSWYGRRTTPPSSYDPATAVLLRSASGVQITTDKTSVVTADGVGWNRYYFVIRLSDTAEYQVAIVPNTGVSTEHSVNVAAVMLENVSAAIYGQPDPDPAAMELDPADYAPSPYVSTRAAGVARTPVCEDSDGQVFRDLRWTRGCVKLCPAGFGTCPEGEDHCYWELLFPLTLDAIERGGLLQQSGFAYGNYNYRIDGVAVNLVGTGLRDCSNSPTPDICYSSGNIPYSITHEGPYEVRNHRGQIYDAPLFTGRIEHGRGLAAERYISNPISAADRALLQDYWHYELRGRPITGNYGLRIWDADGVVFENLEDVQLILDYRYWTRFE